MVLDLAISALCCQLHDALMLVVADRTPPAVENCTKVSDVVPSAMVLPGCCRRRQSRPVVPSARRLQPGYLSVPASASVAPAGAPTNADPQTPPSKPAWFLSRMRSLVARVTLSMTEPLAVADARCR